MPREGASPQRSGPDRREWWGTSARARCSQTTHSGPLQGPTGPASLSGLRFTVAGYPGITPPGIPTRYHTQYPYPTRTPHYSHPMTALPVHREHAHMTVPDPSKENLGVVEHSRL